jgi:ketosteroid isomerase-like protein
MLPLLLAVLLSTPQNSATSLLPLPSVALPSELARVLTDYEVAWQSRNPAALASLFTEDGFVLTGGHAPIRGRLNIQNFYTGQGGPLSLRALHFEVEGSHGFIVGAYTSKSGSPDTGKFTLTLRKSPSGRWLIVSDMDNGNGALRPNSQ